MKDIFVVRIMSSGALGKSVNFLRIVDISLLMMDVLAENAFLWGLVGQLAAIGRSVTWVFT
jgi:hypothetical protein